MDQKRQQQGGHAGGNKRLKLGGPERREQERFLCDQRLLAPHCRKLQPGEETSLPALSQIFPSIDKCRADCRGLDPHIVSTVLAPFLLRGLDFGPKLPVSAEGPSGSGIGSASVAFGPTTRSTPTRPRGRGAAASLRVSEGAQRRRAHDRTVRSELAEAMWQDERAVQSLEQHLEGKLDLAELANIVGASLRFYHTWLDLGRWCQALDGALNRAADNTASLDDLRTVWSPLLARCARANAFVSVPATATMGAVLDWMFLQPWVADPTARYSAASGELPIAWPVVPKAEPSEVRSSCFARVEPALQLLAPLCDGPEDDEDEDLAALVASEMLLRWPPEALRSLPSDELKKALVALRGVAMSVGAKSDHADRFVRLVERLADAGAEGFRRCEMPGLVSLWGFLWIRVFDALYRDPQSCFDEDLDSVRRAQGLWRDAKGAGTVAHIEKAFPQVHKPGDLVIVTPPGVTFPSHRRVPTSTLPPLGHVPEWTREAFPGAGAVEVYIADAPSIVTLSRLAPGQWLQHLPEGWSLLEPIALMPPIHHAHTVLRVLVGPVAPPHRSSRHSSSSL